MTLTLGDPDPQQLRSAAKTQPTTRAQLQRPASPTLRLIGVEEELLLVDAETFRPRPVASAGTSLRLKNVPLSTEESGTSCDGATVRCGNAYSASAAVAPPRSFGKR